MPDPVLLVGKPWRGGLASYVRRALEQMFPGAVEWIPTYPQDRRELARFRRDRTAWRQEVVRRIAQRRYRAALFINHHAELAALPRRDNHVLWLTDDPRPVLGPNGSLDPYAQIFISDPGYGAESAAALGARYRGIVSFAHCPRVHAPGPAPAGARAGLCMIANRDPERDQHLAALLGTGLRMRVVGNYFANHRLFWRHPLRFRPRVGNAAMGAIYGRYAVSLNVHAGVVREGTNMRTFECAGYGISQLVQMRPGLDSLFEPGREIAIYRTPDELPDAARSLLSDPPRQVRLAENARARVLAEHRYEHRLADLLSGVVEGAALRRWR